MAVITEISPQKKDKSRVNIYLDGVFYCGLSLETVYNYHLKKDMVVTEDFLVEIELSSEKSKALDKALSYISKTIKTKKQIKGHLLAKGYTGAVIDYCIDKMTEYKMIDDYDYCLQYVRAHKKNQGAKLIERDLRLKGIDFNLIDKAIEEEISSQLDVVKNIAQKYIKNKDLSQENLAKLYKYILSKGFSYEDASYAVSCVKGE